MSLTGSAYCVEILRRQCRTVQRQLQQEKEEVKKLQEENKKLKEENRELEASLLTWKMSRALRDTEIKELSEENKKLKEGTLLKFQEVEIADLKEEIEELETKATIYEYMSEFMEKADLYGDYFDYIREYYPDERKEAGDFMDSDEDWYGEN